MNLQYSNSKNGKSMQRNITLRPDLPQIKTTYWLPKIFQQCHVVSQLKVPQN